MHVIVVALVQGRVPLSRIPAVIHTVFRSPVNWLSSVVRNRAVTRMISIFVESVRRKVADEIGSFTLIIRPAYTLGGTGGGIAYNRPELIRNIEIGLDAHPVSQMLVEKSLIGSKEYELEVTTDIV